MNGFLDLSAPPVPLSDRLLLNRNSDGGPVNRLVEQREVLTDLVARPYLLQ